MVIIESENFNIEVSREFVVYLYMRIRHVKVNEWHNTLFGTT